MSDPFKKQETFTPHVAFIKDPVLIESREDYKAPDTSVCSYCNHEFEVVTTAGQKNKESGLYSVISYAGHPDEPCPSRLKPIVESNE